MRKNVAQKATHSNNNDSDDDMLHAWNARNSEHKMTVNSSTISNSDIQERMIEWTRIVDRSEQPNEKKIIIYFNQN